MLIIKMNKDKEKTCFSFLKTSSIPKWRGKTIQQTHQDYSGIYFDRIYFILMNVLYCCAGVINCNVTIKLYLGLLLVSELPLNKYNIWWALYFSYLYRVENVYNIEQHNMKQFQIWPFKSDPCRAVLTVAETRLLSVKVRWCGSHLRKNLEVRILLRKVRGCLTTHTWMSPSWSNLYLMPLLLCKRLLLLQGPALWLLFPSGCGADISPSRGLLSSNG